MCCHYTTGPLTMKMIPDFHSESSFYNGRSGPASCGSHPLINLTIDYPLVFCFGVGITNGKIY